MNPFARFEKLAERIFEHDLPRVLGGRLDPVELTLALDTALEQLPASEPPPRFLRLELSPKEVDYLQPRLPAVELELGRYAGARINERWPGRHANPAIRIHAVEGVRNRQARAVVEEDGGQTSALTSIVPVVDDQQERPVVDATVWSGETAMPVMHVPFAIGRSLDNDLVLDESSVSRYHAQIRNSGKGLVIVDLESLNGTQVNGIRISGKARLRHGDEILIGRMLLRLTIQDAAR